MTFLEILGFQKTLGSCLLCSVGYILNVCCFFQNITVGLETKLRHEFYLIIYDIPVCNIYTFKNEETEGLYFTKNHFHWKTRSFI